MIPIKKVVFSVVLKLWDLFYFVLFLLLFLVRINYSIHSRYSSCQSWVATYLGHVTRNLVLLPVLLRTSARSQLRSPNYRLHHTSCNLWMGCIIGDVACKKGLCMYFKKLHHFWKCNSQYKIFGYIISDVACNSLHHNYYCVHHFYRRLLAV